MKRSRLGQNFLFDMVILSRITEAAGLEPRDRVVEIGPGPGTLTKLLAKKVEKVIAIELDEGLYKRLKEEFVRFGNVEIVHGDALEFPYERIGAFKVVANIPYYITTPIVFRLLKAKANLKTMTLTIQKEVAERIVAAPGGKDYGVLSIMVQLFARPEIKFVIPREAFRPMPKVDSAVVHLAISLQPTVRIKDEAVFSRVVKTSFSQRRKTISNSMKVFGTDIGEKLMKLGIDPKRRPETLSIEEFAKIADFLSEGRRGG